MVGIPKPVIDLTFERTLKQFDYEINYLITHGTKSRYPFPYFISQILNSCKENNQIEFIEYIIYLKLYNKQRILPFLSKRQKDQIIKEIKDKYNIRMDYEKLKYYMNNISFEKLAENLGYKLRINRNL